ncbi:MAG: hypothetical protein F6K41_04385 [Symploca sp. SIO3E6]|nr:hypothetical protein [Caldora sp. SIO3E6]
MKRFVSLLLSVFTAILFVAAPALADSGDALRVIGKDTVNASLPLRVIGSTTPEEFKDGTTWGRIIRLGQNDPGNTVFFDLGIDENGTFFINTPQDTETSHSFTITKDGEVSFSG